MTQVYPSTSPTKTALAKQLAEFAKRKRKAGKLVVKSTNGKVKPEPNSTDIANSQDVKQHSETIPRLQQTFDEQPKSERKLSDRNKSNNDIDIGNTAPEKIANQKLSSLQSSDEIANSNSTTEPRALIKTYNQIESSDTKTNTSSTQDQQFPSDPHIPQTNPPQISSRTSVTSPPSMTVDEIPDSSIKSASSTLVKSSKALPASSLILDESNITSIQAATLASEDLHKPKKSSTPQISPCTPVSPQISPCTPVSPQILLNSEVPIEPITDVSSPTSIHSLVSSSDRLGSCCHRHNESDDDDDEEEEKEDGYDIESNIDIKSNISTSRSAGDLSNGGLSGRKSTGRRVSWIVGADSVSGETPTASRNRRNHGNGNNNNDASRSNNNNATEPISNSLNFNPGHRQSVTDSLIAWYKRSTTFRRSSGAVRKSLRDLFRSKKFKNGGLERLYERYFYTLNQWCVVNLLMNLLAGALFSLICHFCTEINQLSLAKILVCSIVIVVDLVMVAVTHKLKVSSSLTKLCYAFIILSSLLIFVTSFSVDQRNTPEG